MRYYAKIENAETKTVSIGTGNNAAFYQSIGMEVMDVEQGYDGQWYVAGHAPKQPIEELRTAALSRIDSATSAAILAGFEYEVETGEGQEVLHFSYLAEDQQNFGDTFNGVAMRKLMGIEELPEAIGWNGWRNHTAEYKGDMVRLTLDADSFLALYTRGALAHKSAHMAIHGERKKAIEAAKTVEEINALLEGWGV